MKNTVKVNKTLECNICLPCVICHFPWKLSDGTLAGEANARIFGPLVFGDHFQCYGVWWRLIGVRNWIWKIDGYGLYQMNVSEMHFLLLMASCRKFLHVPHHAMVWRTLLTKMKEQFGLHNMQITTFFLVGLSGGMSDQANYFLY